MLIHFLVQGKKTLINVSSPRKVVQFVVDDPRISDAQTRILAFSHPPAQRSVNTLGVACVGVHRCHGGPAYQEELEPRRKSSVLSR